MDRLQEAECGALKGLQSSGLQRLPAQIQLRPKKWLQREGSNL